MRLIEAVLFFASLVLAGPLPSKRQASTACSQIASSGRLAVPASLAHACLQSVPNKQQPALKLVQSLKSYASWQSTLAWLKDPPQSYAFPAVDILAELDDIASTVQSGGYNSEYDFQLAIYKLVVSAHDGHFSYVGDVFKPFNFQNNLAADIVSVSVDGLDLPRLYHMSELRASSGSLPSAIAQINGRDATEVIVELNQEFSSFQDPDSQWNSMFPTLVNQQAFLTIASSIVYQGDQVTLTYENGTRVSSPSYAAIYANMSGITSGEDFYSRFCSGQSSASSRRWEDSATPLIKRQQQPTLPQSAIADTSGATAGYFLSGDPYSDVAVLSVSSFAPSGDDDVAGYLTGFQETVASFLDQSRQAGKQRLVVDLSSNGGGLVVAGYELFAQLFPDLEQFGATNLRRTESLVTIGNILESLPDDFTPKTQQQQLGLQALAQSSILANVIPSGVEAPGGQQFTTVTQILEPVTLRGDEFTAYQNTPLDMPASDFNLTGTGNSSNPPPAVFSPENVVLLTDGTCGSTCTIFSYLMIMQANVKLTAVGGRPSTGPMQGIAGVEGSQIFFFADIASTAAGALAVAAQSTRDELEAGDLGVLAEAYAISRASDPINSGSVNGKNSFEPGDATVPVQFLDQAANCRFFYTAPMLYDAEVFWKRAVDATWTDPDRFCVEGSRVAVNTSSDVVDSRFVQGGLGGDVGAGVSLGHGHGLQRALLLATLGVIFLHV